MSTPALYNQFPITLAQDHCLIAEPLLGRDKRYLSMCPTVTELTAKWKVTYSPSTSPPWLSSI